MVGGNYTTKLGYEAPFGTSELGDSWWWKELWKVKALKKTISFLWLALKNKVLIWEMMRKRNKVGPGLFLLCRE
jgi:hypothetical protein